MDYLLLLEDLAPMRPGDQLASCTLAEAHLALTAVAQLHARWWEQPRLDEFASWLPGRGSPFFDLVHSEYQRGLEKFHNDFGHLVTPEIEDLADRAALNQDYRAAGVGLLGRLVLPANDIHHGSWLGRVRGLGTPGQPQGPGHPCGDPRIGHTAVWLSS